MTSLHHGYAHQLRELQIALVAHQKWAIAHHVKALIVFEGRDGAGKDGAIKRIVEPLSIRATRVVALPKPSDRERTQWGFQRYVRHLPAAGEIALFNRSWYNRAGVEAVMGFCSVRELEEFLRDAPMFERMLVGAHIRIVKFWLDISQDEQNRRLTARAADPLKALKISAMDAVAQTRWSAYSAARDQMLKRTHSADAPWTLVHTDHKKAARLAILRHLVHALATPKRRVGIAAPDPRVLSTFDASALTDGRLEP